MFLFARLRKPGLKRPSESCRQDLKKSLNHPRQDYLVRDPILFAGGPWHAMADLVRGHVVTMLYSYMNICLCLLYICIYIYLTMYIHIFVSQYSAEQKISQFVTV